MDTSPSSERQPRVRPLEQLTEKQLSRLELMAAPDRPLTVSRLEEIGHPRAYIAQDLSTSDLAWPDDLSSVPLAFPSRFSRLLTKTGRAADEAFIEPILAAGKGNWDRAFNNFPAILQCEPYRPTSRDTFMSLMGENVMKAAYASKPYLHRAWALEPELMSALQQEMTLLEGPVTVEWPRIMVEGVVSGRSLYPFQDAFLRSSRLAYGLLINLMRQDDSTRQRSWLPDYPGESGLVDDPERELWV